MTEKKTVEEWQEDIATAREISAIVGRFLLLENYGQDEAIADAVAFCNANGYPAEAINQMIWDITRNCQRFAGC